MSTDRTHGIVEFLEARLDEQEAAAKAAATESGGEHWRASDSGLYSQDDPSNYPGPFLADAYGYTDPTIGGHIAHWDPARVLAEVAAKRRVLARHHPRQPPDRWCDGCGEDKGGGGGRGRYMWITPRVLHINDCPELRDLAAPYADHPDYDPAWTPSAL